MPDDPVFTSQDPTPSDPQPQGSEGSGAVPAGIPEDLDTRVSSAVAKATEGLTGDIGDLKRFFGEVSQHLQSQGVPQPAQKSGGEEEWIQRFYESPEGAVDERVAQAAAPIVQQIAQAQVDSQMSDFRQEIDAEYGEGAFSTHIEKNLSSIIQRAMSQNPAAVLDKQGVRSVLGNLAFESRGVLAEHKEKAQTQRKESEEKGLDDQIQAALQRQGIDPTTLSGGIRRTSKPAEKLGDEYHEYLAGQLKHGGRKVDEKRAALLMHENPRTLEEWQALNQRIEKGDS